MRVFEILHQDIKQISEQEIAERIRKFDWKYEFSDDARRISRASRELELIENMVYQLWKKDEDSAIRVWNENAPGVTDKKSIPSFIFRLESQDIVNK
jgi:hypothetical protein